LAELIKIVAANERINQSVWQLSVDSIEQNDEQTPALYKLLVWMLLDRAPLTACVAEQTSTRATINGC